MSYNPASYQPAPQATQSYGGGSPFGGGWAALPATDPKFLQKGTHMVVVETVDYKTLDSGKDIINVGLKVQNEQDEDNGKKLQMTYWLSDFESQQRFKADACKQLPDLLYASEEQVIPTYLFKVPGQLWEIYASPEKNGKQYYNFNNVVTMVYPSALPPAPVMADMKPLTVQDAPLGVSTPAEPF